MSLLSLILLHQSGSSCKILTVSSGFKFLPVLGRYIADCFEGKAPAQVREKWRLKSDPGTRSPFVCNDGSRRGPERRVLSRAEQARL